MRIITKIFLPCLVLVFSNCKKDHHVLAADVQPQDDQLNTFFSDTCTIIAHTVLYDSIPSFNDRYKFLGSNQDPVFGRTDVGLYVNASIPNAITNVSFESKSLIGSEIILEVPSLDFAGSLSTPLSYSVYTIKTSLSPNTVYYTHRNDLHNPDQLVGTYNGTLQIMNEKLVLRIPIDYNYAKGLMENPQFLENNAKFQSEYKGFYIVSSGNLNPLTQQGSIFKFDLENDLSGFYLYMQEGTPSPTKENEVFRFTFSGSDASRFNTVNYQPASGGVSLLTRQVIDKDTAAGKADLFLKGLGGSRIKLRIPSINNFADSSDISVGRAEVLLYVDPALDVSGVQYLVPPRLCLLPISSDNKENYALDQLTPSGLARYDGNYDATNNRYVFNIARHVQAILKGQKANYGFYVVVADQNPIYTARRDNYVERVVLYGTSHSTLKPKFNFTYSKFKKQ